MFEFSQTAAKTLHIQVKTTSLEAGNIGELKAAFEEHRPSDLEGVTVDMAQVEMIDSSGIGALLGIQKCLEGTGQSVCLQNVKPAVVSVIELLRLHQVFQLDLAGTAVESA